MPKDGTATRERILETAQKLVIDNGYSATSVEQVIAASGTSKGAFFHHFESKRALADALVDRYAESDLAHLQDGLEAAQEASDDPAERAIAFLAYYEGVADELMTAQSGCLYSSVLTELQLVSTGASDPIGKAAVAWREGYAALLRDAMPDGADVDALADHVFVTFEGAFLLARAMEDPGHMRRQLRTLRELVSAVLAQTSRR